METAMARPLRLEFPGALYHVTSRGDRQEAIFHTDAEREIWLAVLAEVCARFNWDVHAFCQMGNHYHLVVETIDGKLARGMRHLNGQYAQWINRRRAIAGHLFQGRYHAVLVQRDSYLLELARYVVLNPLRAGLVAALDDWRWSSCAMTATSCWPAEACPVRSRRRATACCSAMTTSCASAAAAGPTSARPPGSSAAA
jgi:REP element-mobilizing transposase RayT